MKFEFVPTLEKLKDLYGIPVGPARFQAYIDTVVGGAQRSAELLLAPLVQANPMAKIHALECVETWIGLGAEESARAILEEVELGFAAIPFKKGVKMGFTVLDDLKGGWTHRTINDTARFKTGEALERTGWVSLPLWTSEVPMLGSLRPLVLEGAFRAGYVSKYGDPQTLAEMLRQEGQVAQFAGRALEFDPDELEYSRAVIAQYLGSTEQPVTFACIYGDDAARELGYAPLGLSRYAGFQVGLANALEGQP